MLLFHVLLAAFLSTEAAALCVGNLVIAASLARARLATCEITVSRQVMYRSVVVVALGRLPARRRQPRLAPRAASASPRSSSGARCWSSCPRWPWAAVLLSETCAGGSSGSSRVHFYRSKYDYREQWISFTTAPRLRLSLGPARPGVLARITEAAGAARASSTSRDAAGRPLSPGRRGGGGSRARHARSRGRPDRRLAGRRVEPRWSSTRGRRPARARSSVTC